jgi:tetratricopeptide (TPR) repeat protein
MNRSLRFFALALLSSSLLGAAHGQEQSNAPSSNASGATQLLLQKARAFEQRGRMDLAAKTWQQILLADPNSVEALSGLARFSEQSGKKDAAHQYEARLEKISPTELARLREKPHQLDTHQGAKLTEAGRLAAAHKPEEAMRLYREVLGDKPPDGDLSIAYYETMAATPDGSGTAVARLRDLARRFPDDPRYAVALGKLETYSPKTRADGIKVLAGIQGDAVATDAARAAWRQALLWERGNAAYEVSLREYLKRYPDSELEKEFGPIRASVSSAEIERGREEQAAYAALRANNMEEAERLFEKLRSSSPDNPKALEGLGFVRMKQENFAAAEEFFQAAKLRTPVADRALEDALQTARFWRTMQQGTQNLNNGQLDDALANFQAAATIRPNNVDAIAGVSGTLMKQGQSASAIPVFRNWTQVSSDDPRAWRGLVLALEKSGDPAAAIAAAKNMPASVRAGCLDDPECLVPLSEAYNAAGDTAESQRLLHQAVQVSAGKSTSLGAQMQIASLLAKTGEVNQAAEMYVGLAKENSDNIDIWEGLIGALHDAHKDTQALDVSARMPKELYGAATQRTDFLTLMAAVYESQGQIESAHRFLEQAISAATANGKQAPLALQMQVAGLWLKEKEFDKAIALYGNVVNNYPENLDAWHGELAALHEAKQDGKSIAIVAGASDDTRKLLEADPKTLGLLASAHSALGEHDLAVRLIRRAAWQYQSVRKPVPADLELQACWILLNAGEDGNLYYELRTLAARTDLDIDQKRSTIEVWSAWSMKRADSTAQAGDFRQSLTILVSARRAFPDDLKVRGAFAGMLLRAGYPRQAFDEYKNWGLLGGGVDDYTGAIASSMSTRQFKSGDAWLAAATERWPNDPKILMIGAKLAVSEKDYNRANRYYQQALAASSSERNDFTPPSPNADTSVDPQMQALRNLAQVLAVDPHTARNSVAGRSNGQSDSLDSLLATLSGSNRATVPSAPVASSSDDLLRPRSSGTAALMPGPDPLQTKANNSDSLDWLFTNPKSSTQAKKATQKDKQPDSALLRDIDSSLDSVAPAPKDYAAAPPSQIIPVPNDVPGGLAFVSKGTAPSSASLMKSTNTTELSQREEVENEIEGISAQFSPYVGTGADVSYRSGQPGFDRLVTQQSNLEASTTLNDVTRLTLVVKPTFLDSGTPTSNATVQLGSLPLGSSFAAMGASGLGAEVQLATQNFGARFGVTPEGFLVQNLIGSFQFRPAGGPIQITVSRDPITDTLLSYAGIRDPGSGQVWGGVIANSISGLAAWGTAESGFYAGMGYQDITGQQVATNTRIDGNVGSYWRVWSNPSSSITIGMNFSGLHYDKNLRFFTFGQGGYFSPQSYFLFNVPFHWKGVYNGRFEYSIDASFGIQHFEEDSSPYYPLELNQPLTSSSITVGPSPSILRVVPPQTIAPTMSYYPSQIDTGANYNLDMKAGYRLTGNWFLGGFIDVNNTRNYTSKTIGFYARYQFHPVPPTYRLHDADLPDWNAIRRLALP